MVRERASTATAPASATGFSTRKFLARILRTSCSSNSPPIPICAKHQALLTDCLLLVAPASLPAIFPLSRRPGFYPDSCRGGRPLFLAPSRYRMEPPFGTPASDKRATLERSHEKSAFCAPVIIQRTPRVRPNGARRNLAGL